MFSGGVNEPGMGAFGSYHEWQAPVRPDGRRRAHFEPMKEFGRLVRCFGPSIAGTTKRTDLAVGFYAPYWTTEYLSGPTVEAWAWKTQHLFYDGLARLLQLANLNYSLVDLERATPEALGRLPALVVFALDFMDAGTQEKLAAYVKSGGRLLLNPDLPVKDLGMQPCTVLSRALGVRPVGRRQRGLSYLVGGTDYLAQGELVELDAPRAEVLARAPEGVPCGVRAPVGGGAWVLAFGMSHVFDYQVRLLAGWLAQMGVRPAVETDGELQLCLRANERHGFLFVANLHDVPHAGRLRLTLPGESRAATLPRRGRLLVDRRRCLVLPLNVPLPGGDVLRYSTAEVLDVSSPRGRSVLVVKGAAGSEAEVELVGAARQAWVDGRRAAAERGDGRLRVRFGLTGGPQRLEVARAAAGRRRPST
jgi:beta-galactosidase